MLQKVKPECWFSAAHEGDFNRFVLMELLGAEVFLDDLRDELRCHRRFTMIFTGSGIAILTTKATVLGKSQC
jgi:hypothetical protein